MTSRPEAAPPARKLSVAVAMSGGVDSAVAAALLVEAGHEVVGVTLRLWPCGALGGPPSGFAETGRRAAACCSDEGAARARETCDRLRIPHRVLDASEAFEREVIAPFAAAYVAGRTPNPCARCNERIKRRAVMERAARWGATHFATGHYARIEPPGEGGAEAGRWRLLRPRDRARDQTYFLFALERGDLATTLFPLADRTKAEVRERARARGLPVADRPASQDACFLPEGGLAALLLARAPGALRPGPVEDLAGKVLGDHRGAALYTVGQRRGLGVAAGRPLYVVRIEPATNTLFVGPEEALFSSRLVARGMSWLAWETPPGRFRALAKIRYATPEAPAEVLARGGGRGVGGDGEVEVLFERPARAITPGQALVLYSEDGEEVLGGGWIEAAG